MYASNNEVNKIINYKLLGMINVNSLVNASNCQSSKIKPK